MKIMFGLILITIFISCQSNTQEKHISADKHLRVDKYDYKYHDSLNVLATQQAKTRDSILYVKAHKKDTVIFHDYSSIIKNLKRYGSKSIYFNKEFIDTATLMCPELLKGLSIKYPRIIKDFGFVLDDLHEKRIFYPINSDTFQIKYSNIIDFLKDRKLLNKLLTDFHEGDKVILEHELYVVKYENTVWFLYEPDLWSFEYRMILIQKKLIIETTFMAESMPSLD